MATAAELASNAAEKGEYRPPPPPPPGVTRRTHSHPPTHPQQSCRLHWIVSGWQAAAVAVARHSVTRMSAGREWWARVKSTVGFEEMQEEEPAQTSLLSQINEATSLNRMQVAACPAFNY